MSKSSFPCFTFSFAEYCKECFVGSIFLLTDLDSELLLLKDQIRSKSGKILNHFWINIPNTKYGLVIFKLSFPSMVELTDGFFWWLVRPRKEYNLNCNIIKKIHSFQF